jgi:hypothetical protein
MVLRWLRDSYYQPYREAIFEWEGHPLLIAFDPMRLTVDPASPVAGGYHYTIKHWSGRSKRAAGGEGIWQWFFAPPAAPCDTTQPPQDVLDNLADGVALIYPRFDESYLSTPYVACKRKVDPDLTQGLYQQQWELLASHRDQLRLIVLYSWNLYGEQAHVEPSWLGPAPVGYDYVEKTRTYYADFCARQPISP